jgi:hypothetical protein
MARRGRLRRSNLGVDRGLLGVRRVFAMTPVSSLFNLMEDLYERLS